MLGATWTVAPITLIVYSIHRVLIDRFQPEGIVTAAWLPGAVVLGIWLLGDLVRLRIFRKLPAAFALSLSWAGAWFVARALPPPYSRPEVIPAVLSGVQLLLYMIIQTLHYVFYRLRAGAANRRANENADGATEMVDVHPGGAAPPSAVRS
jgi:hypothetical protein